MANERQPAAVTDSDTSRAALTFAAILAGAVIPKTRPLAAAALSVLLSRAHAKSVERLAENVHATLERLFDERTSATLAIAELREDLDILDERVRDLEPV